LGLLALFLFSLQQLSATSISTIPCLSVRCGEFVSHKETIVRFICSVKVSVLEAQLEHLGHQEATANQKSNLLDWIPQIFRAVKLCLIVGKSSRRRDLAEFSGMF